MGAGIAKDALCRLDLQSLGSHRELLISPLSVHVCRTNLASLIRVLSAESCLLLYNALAVHLQTSNLIRMQKQINAEAAEGNGRLHICR